MQLLPSRIYVPVDTWGILMVYHFCTAAYLRDECYPSTHLDR